MSGAAKTVIWSPAARIHIRAIDRETAIQILQAVDFLVALDGLWFNSLVV
jgi:hypothetical protein